MLSTQLGTFIPCRALSSSVSVSLSIPLDSCVARAHLSLPEPLPSHSLGSTVRPPLCILLPSRLVSDSRSLVSNCHPPTHLSTGNEVDLRPAAQPALNTHIDLIPIISFILQCPLSFCDSCPVSPDNTFGCTLSNPRSFGLPQGSWCVCFAYQHGQGSLGYLPLHRFF